MEFIMRLSKELVKLLLSVDYAQFVSNYNQILGLSSSSSSCIHMSESAALLAIIDDEQAWDLLFTFSENNPKCSVIEFLLADLSEENHVNDLISDCDASQLESVVVSFQSLVNAHSRIGYLNSNDNQESMAVLSKRLEGLKAELEEVKKKERKREFRQKLTALIGKLKSSTGPSHSDSVLFSASNSDVSSSQGSSASNVGTSVNESSATSDEALNNIKRFASD